MITIEDYNEIRITKIKRWAIYFKYKDRYFILKESFDNSSNMKLYEKIFNGSRYDMKLIHSEICNIYRFLHLKKGIKGVSYVNKYNHNQIDMRHFMLVLIYKGYFVGSQELNQIVEDIKYKVCENKSKISDLQETINYLRKENSKLLEFR